MDDQIVPDTSQWPLSGPTQRNSYRLSHGVVDMRRPARKTRSVALKARSQNLLLDLGKTALIIVDMQNHFCDPAMATARGRDVNPARALAGPINKTTECLRGQGAPIVWLNWGVRPDRLNLSPGTLHPFNRDGRGVGLAGHVVNTAHNHRLLAKDSWGARIMDGLVQGRGDIYVDKHRVSGFWDTPLNAILSNLAVTTLLFAGVNADQCVLGTLMDAGFHGYDAILLEDCTATTSPDYCFKATIHNVRACFGFTTTSNELIEGVRSVV